MKILYVSPVKWQFLFQRHQALTYEFSQYHDIFFLNPADKSFTRNIFQIKPVSNRITLLDYPLLLSNRNNPFIHNMCIEYEIFILKKYFMNLCLDFDLILIADLRRYYIADMFDNVVVHYDISDYPVQIIENHKMWTPIEQKLLKRSNTITAASYQLVKRYKKMGFQISHIGNGYYSPVSLNNSCRNKDFIFSGALFRWINTDVFDRINQAGYRIDIAGAVDRKILKRLKSTNRYLGILDHAEINRILPEYKTGLIPFKHGLLTDNSCPIKLYEYLKSGCNVISTAITEVKNCMSNAVYILDQNLGNLENIVRKTSTSHNTSVSEIETNRWENIGLEYNRIISS